MSSEAVSSLSWWFLLAAASDLNSSACSCAKFAGTWEEAMTSCTPLQGRLHKENMFLNECVLFLDCEKYISVIFWETMNSHWWFSLNRILAVYSKISLEAKFLSLICKIWGNVEFWCAEKSWENKVGKFLYFLDLRKGFLVFCNVIVCIVIVCWSGWLFYHFTLYVCTSLI